MQLNARHIELFKPAQNGDTHSLGVLLELYRPGLYAIVKCTGTADVIKAVNFVRNHGLKLSVRGGGHNVIGNAICDGGLLVDLSAMKSVHIDAESKPASISGGSTLGDR